MQYLAKTLTAAAVALALVACGGPRQPGTSGSPSDPAEPTESDTLTVFTHDAFTLPDELKARFAEETGYEVTYTTPGDSGALVNQLILTKDSPLGDVVFGVDNTFASRAAEAGVLAGETTAKDAYDHICEAAFAAFGEENCITGKLG